MDDNAEGGGKEILAKMYCLDRVPLELLKIHNWNIIHPGKKFFTAIFSGADS